MPTSFYSNGKLLLTGEYAILDGAKGLALPTKFGQYLSLTHSDSENFIWNSLDENDAVWFSSEFSKNRLETIHTSDPEVAHRLSQILVAAKKLNPLFSPTTDEVNDVETKVTFPRDWGLGTSSTLISNIASWAEINPYELLEATFGGSGYDIACATHKTPITYQRNGFSPNIQEVNFKPNFEDRLFFVYLNEKKNSRDAITSYRNLNFNKTQLLSAINNITDKILSCTSLKEFEHLLNQHEKILSKTLQVPTIKSILFADYSHTIKSLGAWGGDFVLAIGTEEDMVYFKNKGYHTILPYQKMIL
ncbi:MAG TPA: GHMP kinase [Maribacter sp.]|uniref:GYDIA family GHMP kinase n=1 Tax=unclassified Maribacter TaxID=2615042 RepID=UPI000ECBBBDA|nr:MULTISPECIES: GYDIA family GHMP kinase [unclassified Maribacter]HAF78732.1 GHMP kinase [Maribacter sp.]|tara:strand:+ start:76480 stop:77391 length:912 start_codon:yes stop_codon:yes gene_type:complete